MGRFTLGAVAGIASLAVGYGALLEYSKAEADEKLVELRSDLQFFSEPMSIARNAEKIYKFTQDPGTYYSQWDKGLTDLEKLAVENHGSDIDNPSSNQDFVNKSSKEINNILQENRQDRPFAPWMLIALGAITAIGAYSLKEGAIH